MTGEASQREGADLAGLEHAGESALRWWVAFQQGDPAARAVSTARAEVARRVAIEWLYALAERGLRRVTMAEAAAGMGVSTEERSRDAAHRLVVLLLTGRWPGCSLLPEDDDTLRAFVVRKLGHLDTDERRAWRVRTPEYLAARARARARHQVADVLEDTVAQTSNLPVCLDALTADAPDLSGVLAADLDATLKMLEERVIRPCVDAQTRSDARESVEEGLRQLLALRHGATTMEALVLEDMERSGESPDSNAALKRGHQRVGKRQRRARQALEAWLVTWHAAAPPGERDLRTAFLHHVPEIFRLRTETEGPASGESA